MSRPPSYDDVLRDRLVVVTRHQVAQGGVSSVRVRDIADEAGTSTNAVYAMFGGKDRLVSAALEEVRTAVLGRVSEAAQYANSPSNLLHMALAYRAWALDNPELFKALWEHLVSDSDYFSQQTTTDQTPDAVRPFQDVIDQGVQAGDFADTDAPAIRVSLWAAINGFVLLETSPSSHSTTGSDGVAATAIEGGAAIKPSDRSAAFQDHISALIVGWSARNAEAKNGGELLASLA